MNVVDAAMVFGGFAGGVTATVAILTPLGRRLLGLEHGVLTIFRVVLGTPARNGLPAQPGVMERLSTQDGELADIKAQIGALKDDMTRRRAREGP